jgi:hypothetical protein
MHGDADLEVAQRLHQREPGAHRSLGVVLVRHREAECRQRAVALQLNDVALVPGLDDLAARGAVAAHELAIRLGLQASGELGGADDVAEHDREPPQLADARGELVIAATIVVGHGTVTQTSTSCTAAPSEAWTCPT